MSPAESVDSIKLMSSAPAFSQRSDDWSLATKIAVASITSQGTMGGLIVAGFVGVCYIKHIVASIESFGLILLKFC